VRLALRASVVALLLAGAACGGGGGGDTTLSAGPLSTYTNADHGFRIDYPQGWTKVEGTGGAIVGFASPKEEAGDDFQEAVTVTAEDLPSSSITLQQYTDAALGQVKKVITDFDLRESTDATVAGRPGHRIVYTGTQGQSKLEWQQLFTIVGDTAWILTFVAEASTYDRYVATAESIINSFALT
jgi:hypothetical protein